MRFIKLIAPICFLILFQSCSSISDSTSPIKESPICTAVYKTYDLTVLSPGGEPADSVALTFQHKATGTQFEVCSDDDSICHKQTSPYTIMHDGFHDSLDSNGQDITVTGQKDDLSFEAEFTFKSDPCHVQKVAGPDTVSLN